MDEDIQKYIWCMTEIKLRVAVIEEVLDGKRTTGQFPVDIELLCLQFRLVLELIALSSLCANKDVYSQFRPMFNKDWNAKRIIAALEKANPNFYPEPTKQVIDEKTGRVVRVEKVTEPYLTKDAFIQVYDKCCDILHRHNPYNQHPDLTKVKELMPTWKDWIAKLLNHHQIQLVNSTTQLWVLMQAKEDGKVHVAEMQRTTRK